MSPLLLLTAEEANVRGSLNITTVPAAARSRFTVPGNNETLNWFEQAITG